MNLRCLIAGIPAVFVVAGATAAPGPECATAFGRTACGYSCLTAYGTVRCAQTPEGVCAAAGGTVLCWDPPPYVRRHYGADLPRPECTTDYGLVACGFHCASGYGNVQCANSPAGACDAAYGQIVCGDSRPEEFRRPTGAVPATDCLHAYNRIACGYACLDGYGDVRCARSPEGICRAVGQSITCFDPPPPPPP
jgi:hypothetical protein